MSRADTHFGGMSPDEKRAYLAEAAYFGGRWSRMKEGGRLRPGDLSTQLLAQQYYEWVGKGRGSALSKDELLELAEAYISDPDGKYAPLFGGADVAEFAGNALLVYAQRTL